MGAIDLERITCLVIDDSEFSRQLICNVLRTMHVGRVLTAENGVQAIEMLKQVAIDPMKLGVMGIDLVICDWIMPQIDGAMVLKWLRKHKDSPDRFMPFIMVSGMADQEKVEEARTLGVNEFLAKPFSIDSICEKITTIINRPRNFVFNYEYFGPDRRRQNLPPKGDEQRVMKKEDVEVLYSGKDPAKLNKKPKVWFFRLPNRLKEKAASLAEKGEVATFDPKLLAVAEAEIRAMEDDYMTWIEENLRKMIDHFSNINIENGQITDMDATINQLRHINAIAHEVRGQGSTFGYPLITHFSQSLYEQTRYLDKVDEHLIDLIKAHMDGIRAVMRDKVKDDGGQIGQELCKSLELAKEKYLVGRRG